MKILYIFLAVLSFPLSLSAQDTSCGIAWGPVINLTGTNPHTYIPRIATQGDTLHVTWEGGGYRLGYRRSTDGGVTWEPILEMISDTVVINAHFPWVLADSRLVYMLYVKSGAFGGTPVCFIRSSDRGETWSREDSLNDVQIPFITTAAARNDTIAFEFPLPVPSEPWSLYRSTDAGLTWDTSRAPAVGQLAIGGGALHLARGTAFPGHGQEVFYKRSLTMGNTWQDSVTLSAFDEEWSHNAHIAVSHDSPARVYVIWRDTKYGCLTLVGCSILMRMSGDGGLTWGDEYIMTDTPVGYGWDYGGEQIATEGTRVAAVWTNDETGGTDMRYSLDRGDSWSLLCNVSPGRLTTDPSMALTPGLVHVLWEDIDTAGIGAIHIFYRRGVFITDAIDQEPEPEIPKQTALLQNYPNPSNSETRIDYSLGDGDGESLVDLRIFNVLGQEIVALVNEQQSAGAHSVKWKASAVASGTYICRLTLSRAGSLVKMLSKPMMVIK